MVLYRRRRVGGRRYPKRKRVMRKRVPRSLVPSRMGGFTILRKALETYVYNTAAAGTFATNSTWLTINPTGVPAPSGIANCYHIPFVAYFSLSQVLNYTELTALADKYKINWVKIKVSSTSTQSATVNLGCQPNIHWVVDEDDAVIPSNINTFKEKMGIKSRYLANGRYTNIFLRPKPSNMIYNAASGVSYAPSVPRSSPWINASAPDVAHFGIKGYIEDCYGPANTAANMSIKFDLTMSISAKDFQ